MIIYFYRCFSVFWFDQISVVREKKNPGYIFHFLLGWGFSAIPSFHNNHTVSQRTCRIDCNVTKKAFREKWVKNHPPNYVTPFYKLHHICRLGSRTNGFLSVLARPEGKIIAEQARKYAMIEMGLMRKYFWENLKW